MYVFMLIQNYWAIFILRIQLSGYKTENPHMSKVYWMSVFELTICQLKFVFFLSFNNFNFEWYLRFDVPKVVFTVRFFSALLIQINKIFRSSKIKIDIYYCKRTVNFIYFFFPGRRLLLVQVKNITLYNNSCRPKWGRLLL